MFGNSAGSRIRAALPPGVAPGTTRPAWSPQLGVKASGNRGPLRAAAEGPENGRGPEATLILLALWYVSCVEGGLLF